MRPILEGIRVLDVGSFVFGPAAATVMADFGADVVKVEPPETGDPYRYLHQMPPLPKCDEDYCWLLTGRGKRSVALDLKDAEAREVLLRLVREADVFVTNYPLRVLADLRLAWRDLEPLNPRLVFAHATGFGEDGPEAEKPGYDATAWWARSGLQDAVRPRGGLPGVSVPGMGDHPSAMALFGAIMLALYQRERTGRGSKVRSSLLANGAWSNAIYLQAMLCGAESFRTRRLPRARQRAREHLRDGRRRVDPAGDGAGGQALAGALPRAGAPRPRRGPALRDPRRAPRAREGALRDRRADPREPRLRALAQGAGRAERHLHPRGAARRAWCTTRSSRPPASCARGATPAAARCGASRTRSPSRAARPVETRPAPAIGQHTDEVLAASATTRPPARRSAPGARSAEARAARRCSPSEDPLHDPAQRASGLPAPRTVLGAAGPQDGRGGLRHGEHAAQVRRRGEPRGREAGARWRSSPASCCSSG